MQNITISYPMTRRWFRDSIGTLYAWDYEDRYFYMHVGGVGDPHWCALCRPCMEAVLADLRADPEDEELRYECELQPPDEFSALAQDIERNR